MIWLDAKFVSLISGYLDRYQVQTSNPFVAIMRCPLCGDSKKSKTKRRGYIYEREGDTFYSCHNCGASMHISEFIKIISPQRFDEYISEKYLNKKKKAIIIEVKKEPVVGTPLESLKKISQLPLNHPTRVYVTGRMIPHSWFEKLYHVDHFKAWVNTFVPEKFESVTNDEPRLIIPLYGKNNLLIGFQGRSLSTVSLNRYITIMLRDAPKFFGLNEIYDDRQYFILEGPIDSMFIDNSGAMAGSSVPLKDLGLNEKNATFVFDNEARNPEIINKISRKIDLGYMVTIFPEYFQHKDINAGILDGYTKIQMNKMLKANSFQGMEAKLRFTAWRKY
jgi:transcription elongation factor Elf1